MRRPRLRRGASTPPPSRCCARIDPASPPTHPIPSQTWNTTSGPESLSRHDVPSNRPRPHGSAPRHRRTRVRHDAGTPPPSRLYACIDPPSPQSPATRRHCRQTANPGRTRLRPGASPPPNCRRYASTDSPSPQSPANWRNRTPPRPERPQPCCPVETDNPGLPERDDAPPAPALAHTSPHEPTRAHTSAQTSPNPTANNQSESRPNSTFPTAAALIRHHRAPTQPSAHPRLRRAAPPPTDRTPPPCIPRPATKIPPSADGDAR